MAIKILAKASLEIERAKKEEKERLPEKINELDGDIMTLMVSKCRTLRGKCTTQKAERRVGTSFCGIV